MFARREKKRANFCPIGRLCSSCPLNLSCPVLARLSIEKTLSRRDFIALFENLSVVLQVAKNTTLRSNAASVVGVVVVVRNEVVKLDLGAPENVQRAVRPGNVTKCVTEYWRGGEYWKGGRWGRGEREAVRARAKDSPTPSFSHRRSTERKEGGYVTFHRSDRPCRLITGRPLPSHRRLFFHR